MPLFYLSKCLVMLFSISVLKTYLLLFQPAPTAELDRTDDKVYHCVMDLVKVVVQLKNDIAGLQPEQCITHIKVHWDKWTALHFSVTVCCCFNVTFWNAKTKLLSHFCIDFCPQSVGMALRDLISSVDEILPTLHGSVRTEVQYDSIILLFHFLSVHFYPFKHKQSKNYTTIPLNPEPWKNCQKIQFSF